MKKYTKVATAALALAAAASLTAVTTVSAEASCVRTKTGYTCPGGIGFNK